MANEVRMWLKVITVAELADKNGRGISPDKLNGTWRVNSNLNWPGMPKSTEKLWDIFRFLMRKTICTKPKRVPKTNKMMLDKPLGRGMKTERHIHHKMYRTKEWLYVRVENTFERFRL